MLHGGGCVFILLIAQVKQSRVSLRANNNRLVNHVTSPLLWCSTKADASSSSSLLRYCGHVTSSGPMGNRLFYPTASPALTPYGSHVTSSGPMGTGYFIPIYLQNWPLRRRQHLFCPHCSGKGVTASGPMRTDYFSTGFPADGVTCKKLIVSLLTSGLYSSLHLSVCLHMVHLSICHVTWCNQAKGVNLLCSCWVRCWHLPASTCLSVCLSPEWYLSMSRNLM